MFHPLLTLTQVYCEVTSLEWINLSNNQTNSTWTPATPKRANKHCIVLSFRFRWEKWHRLRFIRTPQQSIPNSERNPFKRYLCSLGFGRVLERLHDASVHSPCFYLVNELKIPDHLPSREIDTVIVKCVYCVCETRNSGTWKWCLFFFCVCFLRIGSLGVISWDCFRMFSQHLLLWNEIKYAKGVCYWVIDWRMCVRRRWFTAS